MAHGGQIEPNAQELLCKAHIYISMIFSGIREIVELGDPTG
jgi:hypothetical protein